MHLFSVILFALVANMDCLIVGISYGLRKVHITITNNLIIAFLSCFGTFLSMNLGYYLSQIISMKSANIIGCIVLIFIGLLQVKQYIKNDYHNMHIIDKKEMRKLSYQEVFFSGFALMLNNLSLGVGASITGMPIILSSLLTFIFSYLFISISHFIIMNSLSQRLQKYTTLFSGILIIVLGVWELFI